MTIEIIECKTYIHFEDMMSLAKDHPCPEYDCSFEEYKLMMQNVAKNNNFRAWLSYNDGRPIGYVSGMRTYSPLNQIQVHDILLDEKQWGSKCIADLLSKFAEWMKDDNALRVVWTSKISSAGWERFLRMHKIGGKIATQNLIIWEA